MAVLGEKLRHVPHATQSGREVESGAFFLGSSSSNQLYWVTLKGCHVRGTACEKHLCGVHGLKQEAYMSCVSGFPLQGVHQFKSPLLSDMSNRLACGRQHVAD
jgi:hypothetical protein